MNGKTKKGRQRRKHPTRKQTQPQQIAYSGYRKKKD